MDVFTLLSVLLLCFVFSVVHASCPEGQFWSSSPGLCCNMCPAGSFMTNKCTVRSGNDTQCQPCPPDTYSHTANHLDSCHRCTTVCLDKQILVSICNSTMDSYCECPSASFWDNHLLKCRKCTECTQRERLVAPCTKHKDARCEKCVKGTYLNAAKECVLCDHCKKGELVVEECTIWQNTRCKLNQPCPSEKVQSSFPTMLITPRHPRSKNPTSQIKRDNASQAPYGIEENSKSATFWLLVAIIILLSLSVLFLLSYVVYTKRSNEMSEKKNHCKSSTPKGTVAKAGSSEVIIKENNFKFSRTPADVTERLAFYLNAQNGKNWKHLAGLLGYTSNYTQNWELTPTEATQKLLQDWQQSSNATVYMLYSHLRKLRRDDAAAVLLPYLTGQASECETV